MYPEVPANKSDDSEAKRVSDRTRCVKCLCDYEGWKDGDDPLIIHAGLSPTCTFVTHPAKNPTQPPGGHESADSSVHSSPAFSILSTDSSLPASLSSRTPSEEAFGQCALPSSESSHAYLKAWPKYRNALMNRELQVPGFLTQPHSSASNGTTSLQNIQKPHTHIGFRNILSRSPQNSNVAGHTRTFLLGNTRGGGAGERGERKSDGKSFCERIQGYDTRERIQGCTCHRSFLTLLHKAEMEI
jgi:hypothetical protein